MGRTRHRFIFKCEQGHVTYEMFPLGTKFDDHDETTCQECLKTQNVKRAYLVYAEFTEDKEHVGSCA